MDNWRNGIDWNYCSYSNKIKTNATGWIKQKTYTAMNLDEVLDIFEKTKKSTYSVAWINTNNKKITFIKL